MTNPATQVIPAQTGVNAVNLIDCGSMSLESVIGYCSRVLGWETVLLAMVKDQGSRGKIIDIGSITSEDLSSAPIESNISGLPAASTIRRFILGPGIIAVISNPDGRVLDCAVEAASFSEDPEVRLVDGYFDQDEESWEDEEASEEYEDEEDEEDSEDSGDSEEDEFEEDETGSEETTTR